MSLLDPLIPKTVLTSIFIASTFLLTSCATLKSNAFIGGAIGASAGAVGGTLIGAPNHSGTGTLIGAASGAVIGAIVGLLTEPKSSKPINSSSLNKDLSDPSFTSPEVRRIWVPDKIDGNKYIKGHYMFVLERGSVWTMP